MSGLVAAWPAMSLLLSGDGSCMVAFVEFLVMADRSQCTTPQNRHANFFLNRRGIRRTI